MWKLMQMLLPAVILIIAVFEILIPFLTDKPLFGSFRRKKKIADEDLATQVNEAKAIAEAAKTKVKEVQNVVEEKNKEIQDIKRETDNL